MGAPRYDMPERTRPNPAQGARYDEEQVAELLRRAAALDQKRKLERPSLSLDEVEAIAREAGLDPGLVRRAAGELAAEGQTSSATRWLGAPVTKTIERVVDGELTTDDHEGLAASIREALATSGLPVQVAALGRSLSVTTFSKAGVVDVQIAPKDGATRIKITVNSRGLAGGIFGGLIGGVGGGFGSNVAWLVPFLAERAGMPLATSLAAGAASLLAVLGGSYSLARWIYGAQVRTVHTRMDQLAETLESSLRTSLAARAGVVPVSKP